MLISFLTLKKNAPFFYLLFFCEIFHFFTTYETKKKTAFFYKGCKRTQKTQRTQRTQRTQPSFKKNVKERKERCILL